MGTITVVCGFVYFRYAGETIQRSVETRPIYGHHWR